MQTLTSKLESKRDLIASPGPGALQRDKPPVSIEYCVPGNYERIATALAEAIEASLGESPSWFLPAMASSRFPSMEGSCSQSVPAHASLTRKRSSIISVSSESPRR